MKILTVTHFFEAHGGGIERVAGHLCRCLVAFGETSVWAASDEDGAPTDLEVRQLRCLNPLEKLSGVPLLLPTVSAVRRLCQAVSTSDAIIVHDALYLTSILAMLSARWFGKPVLLVQHVADVPFSNRFLRSMVWSANRVITRPMLRAADHVVFISATTRDAFRSTTTRRAPLLLFNGVDSRVFHPSAGDRTALLTDEVWLANDRKVALFVGRFVEKKGLRALYALAQQRPDLLFVFAGQGPIEPTSWGLPNVAVVRGLSGERLASLYCAADVLVLPSVGEGYPLVIQEAMACGLPVICGRASSKADPEASRWLIGVDVELQQPEETARRLSTAIDSLDTVEIDTSEMARYAKGAYDWHRMVSQMIIALQDHATRC